MIKETERNSPVLAHFHDNTVDPRVSYVMHAVTLTLSLQEAKQLLQVSRNSLLLMKSDFRHDEDRIQLEGVVYQLEAQLKKASLYFR